MCCYVWRSALIVCSHNLGSLEYCTGVGGFENHVSSEWAPYILNLFHIGMRAE